MQAADIYYANRNTVNCYYNLLCKAILSKSVREARSKTHVNGMRTRQQNVDERASLRDGSRSSTVAIQLLLCYTQKSAHSQRNFQRWRYIYWYCYLENRRIIPHIVLRFVWSMFFVYCILTDGIQFPCRRPLDKAVCLIVFTSIGLLYFWEDVIEFRTNQIFYDILFCNKSAVICP